LGVKTTRGFSTESRPCQRRRWKYDAGVDGYPLSRIIADYELVLALMLHRVASLDGVEFGDDRGVALVDAWVTRVDRRMDRLTRLPTARPARRGPP
jgi:hypothetical protein